MNIFVRTLNLRLSRKFENDEQLTYKASTEAKGTMPPVLDSQNP